MTGSPAVLAAFEAWKLADLAVHYAEPCPDPVMESLTQAEFCALTTLQATPAANADDVVLKLFTVLLSSFVPGREDPPLRPSQHGTNTLDGDRLLRICHELANISDPIRAAIAEPHRSARRAA